MLKYKLNVDVENTCVKALGGQEAIDIIKEDVRNHKYG